MLLAMTYNVEVGPVIDRTIPNIYFFELALNQIRFKPFFSYVWQNKRAYPLFRASHRLQY